MITITQTFAWTDTGPKKHHLHGTLAFSDLYYQGGDAPDFGNFLPAGYVNPVKFRVWQGLPSAGMHSYHCLTHLGSVSSAPGVGCRVMFFNDGSCEEIIRPPTTSVTYPPEIAAAHWNFEAVYDKS